MVAKNALNEKTTNQHQRLVSLYNASTRSFFARSRDGTHKVKTLPSHHRGADITPKHTPGHGKLGPCLYLYKRRDTKTLIDIILQTLGHIVL